MQLKALYVAITRARNRLYIIEDSDKADSMLVIELVLDSDTVKELTDFASHRHFGSNRAGLTLLRTTSLSRSPRS